MEEYRDLDLTVAAFKKTLGLDELKTLEAGIVLQAYIPDSFNKMKELTEWAKARIASGGAPINIRIVKGANMEMEQVEASLMNWPLAPYDNKCEVDANYKRMVLYGMQPENIAAVNLGIASHNLFEQAFASTVAKHYGVSDQLTYELLEGMGDHVRRTLQKTSANVLLYAPVAGKNQFINAIAYLIRRLDENTTEGNFLRYACDLKTGSDQWKFLHRQYVESIAKIDDARDVPNRVQNRATEVFEEPLGTFHTGAFSNEPDTDWSRTGNRTWAEGIRRKWMNIAQDGPLHIPVVIDGEELFDGLKICNGYDPSRERDKIHIYGVGR